MNFIYQKELSHHISKVTLLLLFLYISSSERDTDVYCHPLLVYTALRINHINNCNMCVGVYDQRHQRKGDQDLHRRGEDLSPPVDRGKTETVAEEASHRSTERERVQQLQVA